MDLLIFRRAVRAVLPRAIAAIVIASFVVMVSASDSFANHGPGTSGGGISTPSGETLKQGHFELSLQQDYTQFEHVSRGDAERRAARAGGFDSLENASISSVSLSYGIFDELQVSAAIGYYWGNNFIDAESDDGEVESGVADPQGLTDLSLTLKWRVMRGKFGNLALIGGVIAPTGRDDVHLDNGELLEPSSQPGTGAWAYRFGLGYSRFLTSRITIDTGAVYTLRTEHDGFTVGDRFDTGVAMAYRLTESIKEFPNYSVFGEVAAVWIGKDHIDGEGDNPNSGGWTVYFSPGFRARFNEHVALTFAPSVPLYQALNGEQVRADFKLSASLSFEF
jgi:hypothetical protein